MQNAVGVTADIRISCTRATLHWSATFGQLEYFLRHFLKKKQPKSAILTSRSQKWPSHCVISGVISGSGAAIERSTQRTHKRGRWSLRPRLPFIPVPLPPLQPLLRRPMSKEGKCCGAGNNGRHGIGSGGCLYSLKSLGGNVSEVGRDDCRMMAKVAGPSLKVTSESPQRRWRRWRRKKRRCGEPFN